MLTQIKIGKMSKSPLNFFGGGMAALNAVQPQMPWQAPRFGGSVAAWMASQAQNQAQYGSAGSPEFQAQAQLDAAAASDPNNVSATGIGSVTGATGVGAVNPMMGAPVVGASPRIANATRPVESTYKPDGSFAAPAQAAATGVFGSQANRQASVGLRPLMNIM